MIHGWIDTDAADQDGYCILDKHAVVTFAFEDIMDLQWTASATRT